MGSYWTKAERKSLILCGGGVCGIAHVGAYSAFEEKGVVFTNFAGASIGSVVAAFAAVRATSTQIRDFMQFDFSTLLDDDYGFVRDDYRLWYECGYYKGDALENKIEQFLETVTGVKGLTFSATHSLFGTCLKIPVTQVWKSGCETKIYSHETTPDELISRACRMSCTYPGIFRSLQSTTDGGLLCNYPEDLFPAEGRVGLLFTREEKVNRTPVTNLQEYLTAIIGELHKRSQPAYNPLTTILIPVKLEGTNFAASRTDLEELYNSARECVLRTIT